MSESASTAGPRVAVLLATYRSPPFLEEQLASLKANVTPFVLHWVDDQSGDDTAERVRTTAASLGIAEREWPSHVRLKVPRAYFHLLERVAADIYLFCDHDDIWEAGKIDATVAALMGTEQPRLCYSEPKLFSGTSVRDAVGYFTALGVSQSEVASLRKAFVANPVVGNTMGINRALRDLFLRSLNVAWEHAVMHDWWLCLLARAFGNVQFLEHVPTTLYRQHEQNVLGVRTLKQQFSVRKLWNKQKSFRAAVALQSRGFLALPPADNDCPLLRPLCSAAALSRSIDEKQSPMAVWGLIRASALPVGWHRALLFALGCLVSRAA